MTSTDPGYAEKDGHFRRKASAFRNRISSDPSSPFAAEAGRYALYVHLGCPWAHRANIVRSLKGLQDIIQLIVLDDSVHKDGKMLWGFSGDKRDPLYGFLYLKELYERSDPSYEGRYTVPTLWDKKTEKIVSNESSEIIRMFYSEFDALLPVHLREKTKGEKGLFPAHLQSEIEAMNDWVYNQFNNGVYKTGFASTQEAYEEHVDLVFDALDRLEKHLSQSEHQPFLFGDHLTEADIRLYTTTARFDVAYHTIFKCNRKMIRHDYPRIDLWLRRIYWDESDTTNGGAFKNTTHFHLYREGYAKSIKMAVVPVGPTPEILPL